MKSTMTTLAAFVVVFWPALVQAAPITYLFNNYPTEQGSGTLSGSITVDDSLGSIPGQLEHGETSDWQVTVTGHSTFPDITFGTTSHPADALYIDISGMIEISATELTIPQFPNNPEPDDPTYGFFGLRHISPGSPNDTFEQVHWGRSDSGGGFEEYILKNWADDIVYWEYENIGSFAPLGGGDPWVLATAVPEPSSIALAAFALLGLGWRKRR